MNTKLPRVLGLRQVTISGVAIIIGAGIYVLLGPASEQAGGLVWMSFLVAAVLCALTALSYAELASMYPGASAEHEFALHALPRWMAFVIGWAMLIGLVIATSAIGLGFATYAREYFDIPSRLLAWFLILVVSLVAASGLKLEFWVINSLAVLQIGGLLFIVVIGLGHFGEVDLFHGAGESFGDSVGGVMSGAALLFFAYIGFDEVVTLSDETKNPHRTIPNGLLLALGISTVIYMLVSISVSSVLTPVGAAQSDHPLTDVVRHTAGAGAAVFVGVIAMLTTTNTTLLATTAASRIAFGMAETGDMPQIFAKVGKRKTPSTSIWLCAGMSIALVGIGHLSTIVQATNFAVYIVFLAVNAMVIILRFKQPDVPRQFKTKWTIRGVAVVPVLGFVATVVMIPYLDWPAVLVGLALVCSGIVLWLITQRSFGITEGS